MTDNSFCDLSLRSLPDAPTWRDDKSKEAGLKRLRVLATFLEQVPDERYDQRNWRAMKDCGTTACALGWAGVALRELTGFNFEGPATIATQQGLQHEDFNGSISIYVVAEKVFGLYPGEGEEFFAGADMTRYDLSRDASGRLYVKPTSVARAMHEYVDERLGRDR